MTLAGFLLDEHVPLIIQARLAQVEPDMQVHAIGEGEASPKGTPDCGVLAWIEARGCVLVTNNRATMPVHLRNHLALGRRVPGILQLPRRMEIGAILEDLRLIWAASSPDDWQDQIIYLPL